MSEPSSVRTPVFRGAVVLLTSGSHEDYTVDVVAIARKNFDLSEKSRQFIAVRNWKKDSDFPVFTGFPNGAFAFWLRDSGFIKILRCNDGNLVFYGEGYDPAIDRLSTEAWDAANPESDEE